ncbi:MAG: hypothetical protein NVSMB17_10710 [Candidatus Dormibacteria bacterium]
MRKVSESSFTIVSNGFADSPAQAMRDFLVAHRAGQLQTILHPLGPDEGGVHEVSLWRQGRLSREWRHRLPSRVPVTYPLDFLVPPWPAASDCWFGFNCLAALRGLGARRAGRTNKVVYWGIDYVDNRFGDGLLTRTYEWMDGVCCRNSDAWYDLSEAALLARRRRHLSRPLAPSAVVPMGAWLDRVPNTVEDGHQARRLVYMGHLVPRQGVDIVIEALAILASDDPTISADIVGRGPELDALKALAGARGVADRVRFHGFVADHRELERILASGSVGLAPYVTDQASFTAFADPGKLKSYLAAGLPVLLTAVPPNAGDLARAGAAEVLEHDPRAFAAAARRLLSTPTEWQAMRSAALDYSRQFDWETILTGVLEGLGFAVDEGESRPARELPTVPPAAGPRVGP